MIHLKQLFTTEKQFPEKRLSIAFLDTGISPVEDFTYPQNRILVFRDLINGKTKPYDDNGHGTHVTGSAIKEKRAHYGLFSDFLKLQTAGMHHFLHRTVHSSKSGMYPHPVLHHLSGHRWYEVCRLPLL